MTLDLSTLNDSQYQAVTWEAGPLLVLAGPGSGKTRVLTFRIARMIEASPEKYFKILGLTFTNKAAAEMRERISKLVPSADERTLLTTFHSFSADMLRQHGHHIGLKPDFTILSQDADRHAVLEDAIEHSNLSHVGRTSEKLLPLISRLIENDITPENAEVTLQGTSLDSPDEIAKIYRAYRRLLLEKNVLDFPSLIAEALSLLNERAGVRKQVQRVYPYICVDEFQDTNLAQYKILKHLVNPKTKNLFIVADDDQIIYQWNGASPERLSQLRNDFGMHLLQLPENYRCPPAVVELANKLIIHNNGRFEGKGDLTAHKHATDTSPINVRRFDTFDDEATWVAQHIAARPATTRCKCVVLARTKKLLEKMVEALNEQGASGYMAARKNEFESASLLWLHSILRLANARSNREYLRRVCKSFYTLEGIDLNVKDIVVQAEAEDGDLVRAWAKIVLNREELSEITRELLQTVLPKLTDRLDFFSFQKGAFIWLDSLPDIKPDVKGTFDEYNDEKSTWHQLIGEISAQYGKSEVTLHQLLQELDLRSKTPPPPKDSIPCFTIHAAKGLEFDHVYLVGLVEDQLPSWAATKKGGDSREMREERRNCFVAITRTQETLSLTYADRVQGYRKHPSRFLYEMGVLENNPSTCVKDS